MEEDYEDLVKEIYRKFGCSKFEFFHLRQRIPGYGRGIHVKIHELGYIEVKEYAGKARVYGLTNKSLTLQAGSPPSKDGG